MKINQVIAAASLSVFSLLSYAETTNPIVTPPVVSVSEPETFVLVGLSLAVLGLIRKNKKS